MKPLPIEFEPNSSFCYWLASYHLLPKLAHEPESISGYGMPMQLPTEGEKFDLMTPSSMVRRREPGYSAEAHSSAKGGH